MKKSALIRTFREVPSTIDLPFTAAQAEAWISAQAGGQICTEEGIRMMSFQECAAALMVCHSCYWLHAVHSRALVPRLEKYTTYLSNTHSRCYKCLC